VSWPSDYRVIAVYRVIPVSLEGGDPTAETETRSDAEEGEDVNVLKEVALHLQADPP